jgi:hypothetical protein
MTPLVELCFWILILSATITYVFWVRLRIWLLRQDLFNIRDELWQKMRDGGTLNDEHYLATREAFNATIRIAPWLSFIVLGRILFSGVHHRHHGKVLEAVIDARRQAIDRLLKYMLFETATGWLVVSVASLHFVKSMVEKQLRGWIARLLDSEELRRMDSGGSCPST